MEFGFIDDGQLFDRFISGELGAFPDVRLSVRLCNGVDQANWSRQALRIGEIKSERELKEFNAEFAAKRIETWSFDRPPTSENILKLHPRLQSRLTAVVASIDHGDPLPDSDPPQDGDTLKVQETA